MIDAARPHKVMTLDEYLAAGIIGLHAVELNHDGVGGVAVWYTPDLEAPPILWCCHVRARDEFHAAPDYATALAWADTYAVDWKRQLNAVPAMWPLGAESHAADLPVSVAHFAGRDSDTVGGDVKARQKQFFANGFVGSAHDDIGMTTVRRRPDRVMLEDQSGGSIATRHFWTASRAKKIGEMLIFAAETEPLSEPPSDAAAQSTFEVWRGGAETEWSAHGGSPERRLTVHFRGEDREVIYVVHRERGSVEWRFASGSGNDGEGGFTLTTGERDGIITQIFEHEAGSAR